MSQKPNVATFFSFFSPLRMIRNKGICAHLMPSCSFGQMLYQRASHSSLFVQLLNCCYPNGMKDMKTRQLIASIYFNIGKLAVINSIQRSFTAANLELCVRRTKTDDSSTKPQTHACSLCWYCL